MTPRMKSSKKWTAFPKEYSDQIEVVFRENFTDYMKDATVIVEGRIYPEEVLLRVGFRRPGELRQSNFETSMQYSAKEKDALERIHNCVDAAATMMLEFLEAEAEEKEMDLPYIWKELPVEGKKIFIQYTSENSSLEAEANKLLGIDIDGLVAEEEESEDALAVADEAVEAEDIIDEESETDDEDKNPRMFGSIKTGKKKKEDLH